MEINNDGTIQNNKSITGNPDLNKWSTSSLVLSLVSFLLGFLLIPQILGIVFGIMGLKSQKKRQSIAGITIGSINLVVIPIIAIITLSSLFDALIEDSTAKVHFQTAKNIENAVKHLIKDLNPDTAYQFIDGQTVDELIMNLQSPIMLNGQKYGPYLTFGGLYKPQSQLYEGYEILINKSTLEVIVNPIEKGSSIKLLE